MQYVLIATTIREHMYAIKRIGGVKVIGEGLSNR